MTWPWLLIALIALVWFTVACVAAPRLGGRLKRIGESYPAPDREDTP